MFFGIDLSCAFESIREGKIPDKDCLLPLMSKVLGYCIVAASTTVKVPQVSFVILSILELCLMDERYELQGVADHASKHLLELCRVLSGDRKL